MKLIRLEINVNHYTPMADSSFIFRFLLTKQAIVNVCNENDQYCFKWGLISALKIVNRPQRCSAYNIDISLEIIHLCDKIKLDFKVLTFPLEIICIKHFSKMTTHMSLSVFGYNEGTKEMIGPLFQVEKALHTIEMDIICTLKMFPLFILIYLKQSNNLYVFLFQ